VSAADYPTIFWSVLAAVGAFASAMMLVAAECFFWEAAA